MTVLMAPASFCLTQVGNLRNKIHNKAPKVLIALNVFSRISLGGAIPVAITIGIVTAGAFFKPLFLIPVISMPITGFHFILLRQSPTQMGQKIRTAVLQLPEDPAEKIKEIEKMKRSLALQIVMSSVMVVVASLWNPFLGILYAQEINSYFVLHRICQEMKVMLEAENDGVAVDPARVPELGSLVFINPHFVSVDAPSMEYTVYLRGLIEPAVHQILDAQESEEEKKEAKENIGDMYSLQVVAQVMVLEELKAEKLVCSETGRKKELKKARRQYRELSEEAQQALLEGFARNASSNSKHGKPANVPQELWNRIAELAKPLSQGNELISIGDFYAKSIEQALASY